MSSTLSAGRLEVPCPLCGSPKYVPYVMAPSHYGPEKHQVTRCTRCGMVYTNPQSSGYLNEVEHRGALARHFSPEHLETMRITGRFLLRLASKYTPGRVLLDFGCGAGGLVKAALEDGWDATGYDLNAGLVERANHHWNFNALQTGPVDQFYAAHQSSFDLIIANQVFEHLQRPLDVGAKLVSLLRPKGVLLVDVPNVHQPGEWISRGRTLDPTSHWCHFSTRTLSELMQRLGCSVVFRSAAPSLVSRYHRLGLRNQCYALGIATKRILPAVGTGVCVIGRKES